MKRAAVMVSMAAAITDAAFAQRVAIDPFVGTAVTWTSNSNLAPSATRESDVILEVSPGVAFSVDGARLRASGTVVLDGLYYVDGTQRDRILPYADLSGTYEAVSELLYLSAGIVTYRTSEDPFEVRSIGPTTSNLFTTTQYRVTPYIESTIGRDIRYGVRSDNVWTASSGGETTSASDGYLTLNRAFFDRDPTPLGGGLSVEYQKSDYDDTDDTNLDGLTQTLARAALRFGPGAGTWIGLRGGYEDVSYGSTDENGAIYGVEFSWRPDRRLRLNGFWEDRFFGSAWNAVFAWRGLRTAMDVTASRSLTTYSEQLFNTPSANVLQSLDSVLTSQIVDPLERAREARRLLGTRGIASSLPRAADIYSTQVNLQTDFSATVSVSLPRTTAALTPFYRKTVPAPGSLPLQLPGIEPVAADAFTRNEQFGAALTGGYLLSPVLAVSALAAWTRVESLDRAPDVQSNQASYRLALIRQLAPRTAGNIGVRWQHLTSDLSDDIEEGAVFIGLLHRF